MLTIDTINKCEQGFISPKQGAVRCEKCPASTPVSAPTRTFCFAPHIPTDVKALTAAQNISSFEFDRETPYYYEELKFDKGVRSIMFNIIDQHTGSAILLASSRDKPNDTNYMWSGIGANITIMIGNPEPKSNEDIYLPVYFMIKPEDVPKLVTKIVIQNIRSEPVVAKGPTTEIKLPNTVSGYYFFSVPDVQPGARLNLTIVTSGDKAILSQSLFYSNKKGLQFPNGNDYTQATFNRGSGTAVSTLIVEKTTPGSQYFSVYPSCPFSQSPLILKILVNTK
jgi:hypothetical protein